MTDAETTPDHPISQRQGDLIERFAVLIGKTVPDECYQSNGPWWGFLNRHLTRAHKDIANEIRIDFGKQVYADDPVSVIGALFYNDEVQKSDRSKKEFQLEEARRALMSGVHHTSIEDQFDLTEKEVWELIRELERDGHLISTD